MVDSDLEVGLTTRATVGCTGKSVDCGDGGIGTQEEMRKINRKISIF
jgi:hypothetical protein